VSDPQQRWSAVDAFVNEQIVGEDEAMRAAATAATDAGLPWIAVTPAQGKLLFLLTRITGARRVLELGTLGGYSTIWIARALPPDGSIVSLELEEDFARVARANIDRAGVGAKVEIRVGRALDSLRDIAERGEGPYDLAFLDADKQTTPQYFTAVLALMREGGLMVFDNTVRGGEVANADSDDAGALGMRRTHELLAAEPRVSATTIQTVGDKGYDGFTLALLDTPPGDGA